MGALDFLSSIVKPITNMIDNLTTTDEERGKLKNELTKIENEFLGKALEYEAKLLDSQGRIVEAEAKGQSWLASIRLSLIELQRNWRPTQLGIHEFYFCQTPPNSFSIIYRGTSLHCHRSTSTRNYFDNLEQQK